MTHIKQLSTLVLLLAAVGCSSDDCVNEAPEVLALCSRDSVLALTLLSAEIETITSAAQGDAQPPYVTWIPSTDPGDPPFTFDFSIEFDTSSDFKRDTVMAGKATFSADPSDGIEVNDTVRLVYDVMPVQDSNTAKFGSVDQLVRFTSLGATTISGDLDIENMLTGCSASYDIAESSPLALSFPNNIIDGPQPLIEIGGLRISGTMQGRISADGLTFTGDVTLSDTTQDALYHGNVNGDAAEYSIRLFPTDSELAQLGNCVANQQIVFLGLSGIVEELTDLFIESGRKLEDMPSGGGVIFISSGTVGLINYEIDLEVYTGDVMVGTMSGQLSIWSDQSVPGGRQTILQISYNIDAEVVSPNIRFDGRNGSEIPFRSKFGADDEYVYYGTGLIDLTNSCDTMFNVPETDPLEPDGDDFRDGIHKAGENSIFVELDPDTLSALLIYTEDGTFAINIDLNGIAIPPEALDQPILED